MLLEKLRRVGIVRCQRRDGNQREKPEKFHTAPRSNAWLAEAEYINNASLFPDQVAGVFLVFAADVFADIVIVSAAAELGQIQAAVL